MYYRGQLRTENIHERSGNSFVTDAPTDNHGRGEAFSPTDLTATSLANCMLTVMGIKAQSEGFDLEEASAVVHKTMAADPRRIAEIKVEISLKANCSEEQKKALVEKAENCPVALSLHPETRQVVSFEWH